MATKFYLLALWVASFGWSSMASAIPIEWTALSGGNGHSYELIVPAATMAWSEAREDAESRGGYLATPTSAAENQWIYDTLSLDEYSNYWQTGQGTGPALGAFWNTDEESWQWVTGESWTYTHWRAGQDVIPDPNSCPWCDTDWGMSYSTLEGVSTPAPLWQAVPFNDPGRIDHIAYVVEYPIPEPSTALLLGLGLAGLAARRGLGKPLGALVLPCPPLAQSVYRATPSARRG